MTSALNDFIRAQTTLAVPPFVPEITLQLATEITPLWQATESWLEQTNTSPPYWAFAWPGGQGLARYLLDHPELARGKRVLDFAAGCGIAAIAAAKAGATQSMAVDIDPLSQAATAMNAAQNKVSVKLLSGINLEKLCPGVDLIIAGDVCYEQTMSHKVLRWLRLCATAGTQVLLADPGRAYVPEDGLEERARYTVPALRELEDRDTRDVTVWRLLPAA